MLRPEENGVKLAGVIEAFEQTQLSALKKAVDHRDVNEFNRNYTEAISVCNSCHQSTGRPFIIITEPTGLPVSNQQWAPPAER